MHTDLQAYIHTDGRRIDDRKENIQTDRVTNNNHKNMHTGGRTDTRTDGHIDNTRAGRQAERNIHKTVRVDG